MVGKPVSSTSQEYNNHNEARNSPLAKSIFDIKGTASVFIGPTFVTVTKTDLVQWDEIKQKVSDTIETYFNQNQKIETPVDKTPYSDDHHDDDPEVILMIKELLDSRIRPVIQDDGGDVQFHGYKNGVVKLKLQGACRTCSSSTITLKSGIENMLKHYIPEIDSVEQVMDETDMISESEFKKLESNLENNK
ncbi:HIRA-interacting protein 5 [Rozella allomycis CSF55]|uniref:HIRA-interacting protein 5 n=1 Tax=Rozella allomycis (strain CSF55) TaxID=988480 RepID=A0A075AYG3_ROZAC|nr:NIF system FeS cluster assembly, NifU domain-containing protein [Rozella allomycis CSF55]RKP21516.1 HIRA-interacting protein 5 [Rozella allomycis CSF55]|eukprot:EPZ35322.1 NIF system FeS cluster assembly, NifU domain-containing protein [Rozella allomycis CSF55]